VWGRAADADSIVRNAVFGLRLTAGDGIGQTYVPCFLTIFFYCSSESFIELCNLHMQMGIVCEIVTDASSLAFEILHTLYIRWRFRSVNPEICTTPSLFPAIKSALCIHHCITMWRDSGCQYADSRTGIRQSFKPWLLSRIFFKDRDGRSAGHLCQGNLGPSNTMPLPRFPYKQRSQGVVV
jgi:hypothetical protein